MSNPRSNNRRVRRNAATVLAKEIMHGEGRSKKPSLDWTLWCLTGVVAIALMLVAPQLGRGWTVALLSAMWVLTIHPVTQFPWVKDRNGRRKQLNFSGSTIVVAAIIVAFGFRVMPPRDPWEISDAQKNNLVNRLFKLKQEIGQRPVVEFAYSLPDPLGYRFCEKLLLVFTEADWEPNPRYPVGLIVNHPVEGVRLVYRKQGDFRVQKIIDAMRGIVKIESQYDPLIGSELSIEVGSKPPS